MTLDALLHWLKETPISQTLSESDWMFPTIESAHVIAISFVVGSIAIVDLRLLGLMSKNRTPKSLIESITPLTWIAFTLSVLSGVFLFIAKPVTYGHNVFFIVKLMLIGLAGANMAVFHVFVQNRLDLAVPFARPWTIGQVSGLASLAIWTAVIACGRWIGFTI